MQIESSKVIKVLDKRKTADGKSQYQIVTEDGSKKWAPLSSLQNDLEILADYEFEQEQKNYQNQQLHQLITEKSHFQQQQQVALEQNVFVPEKIMGKKTTWGKLKYKVKWKGQPWTDCSWELASTLRNSQHLITEFEERDKQKSEKKRLRKELKESHRNQEDVFLTDEEDEDTKSEKQLNQLEILLDKKNECLAEIIWSSQGEPMDEEEELNKRVKLTNDESQVKGCFNEGDRVNEVLCIQAKNGKGFQMNVSWWPRKNGIVPGNSVVNSQEICMNNPEALIRFYENKVKFVQAELN